MNLADRMMAAQIFHDTWHDAQPFEWGRSDCVCGVLEVRRLAGLPSIFSVAGRYTTELGALRVLKKLGFDNVGDAMNAHFEPIAPAFSLPADILAYPADDPWDLALGIKINEERALAINPDTGTWQHADARSATHAWRLA